MTTLSTTAENPLVRALHRSGLLAEDLDYHVVRASMVIMFFFFGYQKWFPYEFERLVPFISNGPLIWWLYPVFGHAGASYFLGASEWTFGALLLAGFWDKRLGILGALGSTGTLICFRLGPDDARHLAPLFDREHQHFNPHVLYNLELGEAWYRGSFLYPDFHPQTFPNAENARQQSRRHYTQPRRVTERQIARIFTHTSV